MKVLHILNISLPKLLGYSTRSYYLISHQKNLGVTPVVLTSERFGKVEQTEENIEDVKYYRTIPQENSFARKIPILAQISEISFLEKRIIDVIKNEKPDIIHAHSPSFIGKAAQKASKRFNIPFVYEIRAFWEDAAVDQGKITEKSLIYKLRRHHETGVVRKADAIVVICEGLKNDLTSRGIDNNKIHKVMNGVDADKFRPMPQDDQLKISLDLAGKTIVGFIGSFFRFEGIQLLIESVKKIVSENNKITFLLVGGGEIEAELHQLAKLHNVTDHILFTGRIPHDQILKYYSIIDLFVYPRISMRITELVTALKPLEAMAMEKPVLMSNVGGMKELVDAPNIAEFFKAGDLNDLTSKILDLCKNPNRMNVLGNNARINILQKWGWEKRANKDIKIYKSLL